MLSRQGEGLDSIVRVTPLNALFDDHQGKPPLKFLDTIIPIEQADIIPKVMERASMTYEAAEDAKMYGSLKDDPLNVEGVAAVMKYTDNDTKPRFYSDMNAKCYMPDRELISPYIDFLWLFMHALRHIEPYEGTVLYRGVKLNLKDQYVKDREITWHGVTSCTTDIEVLQKKVFCGDEGDRTMFVITLTQGQAREISRYSTFPTEREVVLPPGTKVKVEGRLLQGELTVIQMKEIPSNAYILNLKRPASITGLPAPTPGTEVEHPSSPPSEANTHLLRFFGYTNDPKELEAQARLVQLRALEKDLKVFINRMNCNPIMVRLAWQDAGTYDQRIKPWPQCGGANGAIRFGPEITMGANAGLYKAIYYFKGAILKIEERYPLVSWADAIQMASVVAIELAGGPKIPMKYGRVDVSDESGCAHPRSREGFADNAGLPEALPGYSGRWGCGASDPATHLRNVFTKKMGFNDQEIVALSGAHTIGRAFKERSGTCPFGYSDSAATKYTKSPCIARKDGAPGIGMAGGIAWTKDWLTFNNSYFHRKPHEEELLWFPTDAVLATDPSFKIYFEKYAQDEAAFFEDYAKAHKKLSELGAKFEPASGIFI